MLLLVFAVTPDPTRGEASNLEPTAEPTAAPECVVCPIDQECDPASGQCRFIDRTPAPCVETAVFDEGAGSCLPTGVVAPPAPTEEPRRIPREPRERTERVPSLPAIG